MAGAVVCGLLLARCWRLALVALLAGLLLLFSEVYVGAAYPSQVGVGAAAGLLVCWSLWPVASRLLLPVVAAIGSSRFRDYGGGERVPEKASKEASQTADGPEAHPAHA